MSRHILWLRKDLRRDDHPALAAAASAGQVLPVFILDPVFADQHPAQYQDLCRILPWLSRTYDHALVIKNGDPMHVLPNLAASISAMSVFATTDTTPAGQRLMSDTELALGEVSLHLVGSGYAISPGTIKNKSGRPYRVFTPFLKAWRDLCFASACVPMSPVSWVRGVESDLVHNCSDYHQHPITTTAALQRWQDFIDRDLLDYDTDRDRPDLAGTSQLSAALAWGSIHPRMLLADLADMPASGPQRFVAELAWREFYADVLWHNPNSAWQDLNRLDLEYDDLQQFDIASKVAAWQQGRTGFPIVDAGMRQLLATGWMHNRVRMITASFLTKHLHVWWPTGARYFAEKLVDFDLASNSHGWQWVAGTGTDASPYFRIFNPTNQGLKFDPDGSYVRRWIPELRHLPGKLAHEPWRDNTGYRHGYPSQIIELATEREVALSRYRIARQRRLGT